MARRAEPDYVSGERGRYEISPPIVHPPRCVCVICPRHRKTAESWLEPLTIRARRKSPYPNSRPASAGYAMQFKREHEAQLLAAVEQASERRRASGAEVTFGRVCDAYRDYLRRAGKRLDRASSLINNIEALLGRSRDASTIGWVEYQEVIAEVSALAPQTQRHYAATLVAMLNFATEHRVIQSSAIGAVPLPSVPRPGTPVTWTPKEIGVILGAALEEYEREQAASNERAENAQRSKGVRGPSLLPLRGLCYVAYYTLMRPLNNRALTWEEISIDEQRRTGTFELDQHKNVNRGIKAKGPLARPLVDYLLSIRPSEKATGIIHPNPATGKAYVDIRKQWDRLIAIASRMLGYELAGDKADFFTFRATGASSLAMRKPGSLMLVVNMMGDTNVETVRRHYFNFEMDAMQEMVDGWEAPVGTDVEEGKGPTWTM